MTKHWAAYEGKVFEWNDQYDDPEVRNKYQNYWVAWAEACHRNSAHETLEDYPDAPFRPTR
jgi:hypothetical protein